MTTLADELKFETNIHTIFEVIDKRAQELSHLLQSDKDDDGFIDYIDFSADDLEDLTFIRQFERYMTLPAESLSSDRYLRSAADEVTWRIDKAREAKGLPREALLERENSTRSLLPCDLAYLIKTGREIRRWLRNPGVAA